jgi:hypothetical protein
VTFEPDARDDGWHTVFREKFYPRVDERKPGIEKHAICIVLRSFDTTGETRRSLPDSIPPPFIGLYQNQDIGRRRSNDVQERLGVPIGHQNIAYQQADLIGSRLDAGHGLHLPGRESRIWPDSDRVV